MQYVFLFHFKMIRHPEVMCQPGVIMTHPGVMVLNGPSQSGKSTWVKNFIEHMQTLMAPCPERILYVQHKNSTPPDLNTNLPFSLFHDINTLQIIPNSLLIIDDLYGEALNSEKICQLFIRGSHHLNCSVILTTQNIFSSRECKYAVTMNRNSNYLVLFRSPRDSSYIRTLSTQIFPENKKLLMEAFKMATKDKAHGYLFVDLTQNCAENLRLKTNIFQEDGYFQIILTEG